MTATREPSAVGTPRRVAVSGSRRAAGAASRRVPTPGRADLDEQTRLGELLLVGLMRAQLTAALRTGAAVGLLLGGLPLLFALVPATRTFRVLGLPLPWLLLGVLAYPLLIGAGALHLRRAERIEAEFTDLVDRA